jgi:hypothetical protein
MDGTSRVWERGLPVVAESVCVWGVGVGCSVVQHWHHDSLAGAVCASHGVR